MKKVMKSFTFWFVVLGVAVVMLNVLHLDDMNILMIGLNPILNLLSSSALCANIAAAPYLWHGLSLVTMAAYGFVLDGIKYLVKPAKSK